MLCDLLNRELRLACRGFLGFLSAMGCFFVCLRVKDDDRHPNGRSHASALDKKSDVAASRNQLSSLFAAEERENSSAENKGSLVSGSPHIGKEIMDEARFLKACGTIPETPSEIRRAGEKLRRSPPNAIHSDTPKFHSWMPNTGDKQLANLSGCEIASESPGRKPISTSINFMDGVASGTLGSEVIDEGTSSTGTPFTPWPAGRSTQGASKSVHFDHDVGAPPHVKSLTGDALKDVTSKDSMMILPPPTPLKLSDGMQTPGTVFPANMENLQNGKGGIRSQYVYSVPNPITDSSQGNDMEEKVQQNQLSDEKETQFEASLSAWLKPPKESGKNFPQTFRRTYGDRPILGLVATHWHEEEQNQTNTTPKWWDGNGIPNSTSKYKEDQKVSWHATPFEERLEKALSEDSSLSLGNRSRVGGPATPEEDGDSAISRLRSTPHKKTLLSC